MGVSSLTPRPASAGFLPMLAALTRRGGSGIPPVQGQHHPKAREGKRKDYDMHTETCARELADGTAKRRTRACAAEGHPYSERTCANCGGSFCYSCAAWVCQTPYIPNTVTCPWCGEDMPL